ncbi:hypothetical protein GCM10027164_05090 [Algoriphagus taiwanensis]
MNGNYKIKYNGENNSWRKDVVSIDLVLTIDKEYIDSLESQIQRHKYFNSNLKCCAFDAIYQDDKNKVDKFYENYNKKTSKVKSMDEITFGQYQIDYLSYDGNLIEGKWVKKDNQIYEFIEIYDNTGMVHKRATLNKSIRELSFKAWPSP